MKRNNRKLIRATKKAMLKKLNQNLHKPGFEKIDLDWAFKRAREEFLELECEMYPRGDTQDIIDEAADCINFLAFIIYECGRRK